MKKLNFYFAALVSLAIFFTSCETVEYRNVVMVTFENVALPESGYKNNFPDGLILGDAVFCNNFEVSEWGAFWDGFAVSRLTDRETPGFANQFSVFASSGANNSEQFAVVHPGFEVAPSMQFFNNQEFEMLSLMVNNTTFAALAIKNGDGMSRSFANCDWFKLIITGFDASGNKTGKVEFYLADFRSGRSFVCQQWTRIDLSRLGKVNRLEFTFDSTDYNAWGILTPQYAAIDNIIYVVPL